MAERDRGAIEGREQAGGEPWPPDHPWAAYPPGVKTKFPVPR